MWMPGTRRALRTSGRRGSGRYFSPFGSRSGNLVAPAIRREESLLRAGVSRARTPIYRDWIVLILCRPFFRKIIFHWHTAGLGEWMETTARPLGTLDLPVGSTRNRMSASCCGRSTGETRSALPSRQIEIVPERHPRPCPDFDSGGTPPSPGRAPSHAASSSPASHSLKRNALRLDPMQTSSASLFISLCMREKGLFDHRRGRRAGLPRSLKDSPLRLRFDGGGLVLVIEAERAEFQQRIGQAICRTMAEPVVDYRGFCSRRLRESRGSSPRATASAFRRTCRRSFGLVLLEGMAFGLALVTTNWRDLSELLPPNPNGVVAPKSPELIAMAINVASATGTTMRRSGSSSSRTTSRRPSSSA
jgi:hypothetical protein